MIRIRYRDPNELSPGLHAEAERRGRCTTVYLLSGLTKQERRAALRRLRLSARMGYCPSLPAPQLALALFKDRIRTGAWQTGAVVRLHPAGSTLPIMVLSGGAIAFLLLSTVSIHVLRPRTTGETTAGAPPIAAASAIPFPGASRDSAGGGLGSPGQSGPGSMPVSAVSPVSGGLPLLNSPGLIGPGTGGTIGPWTSASSGGTGTASSGSTSQTSTSQGDGTNSGSTNSGGNNAGGNNAGGNNGGGNNGGGNNGGTSQSSSENSSSTSGSTSSDPGGSGTSSSSSDGSGTSTSGSTSTGSTTTTPTQTTTPAPSSTGSGSGGVCVDVGPLGVCLSV